MKYGFVIDNRKCIGCHACTVACKSEHDVPLGVNRTWVKQIEKGQFPDSQRVFSVMRCNQCTDAPCVEICPTQALFTRDDGIVDFNNDRCIGCKSCMQACPYDALYIDPETKTAAKCNYCAHRVDIGLEPACVNVCPEHAIISGDMEDPNTEISQLLSREQVTVRKPEKGTKPNVFYINGDAASLNPNDTEPSQEYMWNSQSAGVGHYARYAENLKSDKTLVNLVADLSAKEASFGGLGQEQPRKSIEVLMEQSGHKRVYDSPDKGVLWGWEVNSYVLTKAISAGAILLPLMRFLMGGEVNDTTAWVSIIAALVFLGFTGILLVMDLDQPKRFAYVILRPHWKSWLVKGAYIITVFGGLVSLLGLAKYFHWQQIEVGALMLSGVFAVLVAIYTAFLFAQAKGRDFWQSPSLVFHMLIHSVMAGTALFGISAIFDSSYSNWGGFLQNVMVISILINLLIVLVELTITHPTIDSKMVVKMITTGRYKRLFWIGTVLLGNMLPLGLALTGEPTMLAVAGVFVVMGIYITEKIWVEAPQRIPLS